MPPNRDTTIDLRSKSSVFRILIAGRANAGKTTLLKKVCDSVKDPETYSLSGKIRHLKVPGSERGERDLNDEVICKSNRQFIFHDSRGFEGGSSHELGKVTAFIAERAGSNELSQQLHAIWYCLPTDNHTPLTGADELFFNTSVTGNVPVIVIFTKFDYLVHKAFTELVRRGATREDAAKECIDHAKEILAKDFEARLDSTTSPPVTRVRLDDMRKKSSSCHELIEKTANTLSDETLRLLFVSVQQNNIDLCIRYAVHEACSKVDLEGLVKNTLAYFPHIWLDAEYDDEDDDDDDEIFLENVRACVNALETKYPGVVDAVKTEPGKAEVLAALCIIMKQTFIEAFPNKQAISAAFPAAVEVYLGSHLRENVNRKIAELPPSQQDKAARIGSLTDIIMSHPLRMLQRNVNSLAPTIFQVSILTKHIHCEGTIQYDCSTQILWEDH